MVKSVSITDAQFRIGVGAAGIALVAGIAAVRFCGPVSLPPRPPPPPPEVPHGTSSELLTKSVASPVMYQDFVARDAAEAGVRAPARDEMSRKLPYHVDDARHVLEVGQPSVEIAGVRLRAIRIEDGLALEIANATASSIAYNVVATAAPACDAAPARLFNAMTIRPKGREIRVECAWHAGTSLVVVRVETVEVMPLSVWYLDHVPPSAVGIEPRIARGHQSPETGAPCAFALPQAVRSGLERGEIGWRDLIDFYARHRCQTYQFPLLYRAFKRDGERNVPATSAGM
jgi:hypothetical protein